MRLAMLSSYTRDSLQASPGIGHNELVAGTEGVTDRVALCTQAIGDGQSEHVSACVGWIAAGWRARLARHTLDASSGERREPGVLLGESKRPPSSKTAYHFDETPSHSAGIR